MTSSFLLWMIFGMTVVTVFSRVFPIILSRKYNFGPRLTSWLDQVPSAVMASIVAPALITSHGKLDFSFTHTELWVGLATIILALLSKNLYLTIIGGVILMIIVSVLFR